MTATRSEMWRTTDRSCATKMKVRRRRNWSSRSKFNTCACTETSSAETGSSATTRRGLVASARAMPMRWRWPPLKACGKRCMNSGRSPTSRSSSATRSMRSRRLLMPLTNSGSPTLSSNVMRGLSEPKGSWKIIWMSRRSSFSSAPDIGTRSTTLPSRVRYSTCPAVGSCARRIERETVVLPQPDSPTSPSVSPSPTVKLTSSTARTCPTTRRKNPLEIGKYFRSSLTSSSGGTFSAGRLVIPVQPRRDTRSSSPAAELQPVAVSGPPRAPLGYHFVAARMERASRRAIERMRQGARDYGQRGARLAIEARDRTQQRLGVGMLGRMKDVVYRTFFHDAAEIHHHNIVRHLCNDPEIMGDEDDRGVVLVLELAEKRQDLRLRRHVDRRGRFVGDQQARPAGERHRDHGALTQPAGQLPGIGIDALFRHRDADV